MRAASALGVAAALGCLLIAIQVFAGAYQADFAMTADEPAHVVSSLMIRDYLTSGRLAQPWEFAKTYYVHYPKVALLHWPPGFHFSEALWSLGFGRSRMGLISFQGALGTALAACVFFVIRRLYGWWIAAGFATLLVTTPAMQLAAAMVSPDLMLGAFAFAATWLYAKYLDRPGLARGLATAVVIAAALAVHGRGAALLLVPVVSLVLLGRMSKMGVAAGVLTGLVLVLVPPFLGHSYALSPSRIAAAAVTYPMVLGRMVTWPVVGLALVGTWEGLRSRRGAVLLVAMIALVASSWIFHVLVNVPLMENFVVAAAPAMIVLAAGGASMLASRRKLAGPLIAILCVGIAIWNVAHLRPKPSVGARYLTEQTQLLDAPKNISLVAGDATFEGALIAEVALRDNTMQHVVLRGSKMLAYSTWSGASYRLLFPDPPSVAAFLDNAHVGWIVIRDEDKPHVRQLETAVQASPQVWQNVTAPELSGVRVFTRKGPMPKGAPHIEIDLRDRIGSVVQLNDR